MHNCKGRGSQMPVTVCSGHCSEHPGIIVKAAPLGTWYLGTYQLMREELKRILLPPDLGPSENKGFQPQLGLLPKPPSERGMLSVPSVSIPRERDSHSLP